MTWDPAQYLKFGDHRLRPAIDLINRIDLESPGADLERGSRSRAGCSGHTGPRIKFRPFPVSSAPS